MKNHHYLLGLLALLTISSCNRKSKTEKEAVTKTAVQDSLLFSFSFVGCNRVEYDDRGNPEATDSTTANIAVLQRIFNEISNEKQHPELFFFLGDLVLGLDTTESLSGELGAWVQKYNDNIFNPVSTPGMELVAVPGNHEMLFYNTGDDKEYPLKGAIDVWMQYMEPYMPRDRDRISGADSLVNRATFSFVRHNTGFIVMDTDTYNAPTPENPYGKEGMTPTGWIIDKIKEYRETPEIDHIFVLGHKPYYVNGEPETDHEGLPEGPVLWPALERFRVPAMLSAHVHDYQRMQPGGEGTYQIIAGNGGSQGEATFFGYSTIRVYASGKLELLSKGFDKEEPYYKTTSGTPVTVRDSTLLSWTANANPYGK